MLSVGARASANTRISGGATAQRLTAFHGGLTWSGGENEWAVKVVPAGDVSLNWGPVRAGGHRYRNQAKKDSADSEKRAKDLEPPKDKGKDVKDGGFRLKG